MEEILEIYNSDIISEELDFPLNNIVEESYRELLDDQLLPCKSNDGWVLFVTNIHEEANENDITDHFQDFGKIINLNLNLDRRTGFAKGYALIEYKEYLEAFNVKEQLNDTYLLGQKINIDWCFVKESYKLATPPDNSKFESKLYKLFKREKSSKN